MANILSPAVYPRLHAMLNRVLFEHVTLPMTVSRDTEPLVGARGDRVRVPHAANLAVADLADTGQLADPPNLEPARIDYTLDIFKVANFRISSEEETNVQEDYVPRQMEEAFRAVQNAVETAIVSNAHSALNAITLATDNTVTQAEAASAVGLLNTWGVPRFPRYMTTSHTGYANLLGRPEFTRSDQLGGEPMPFQTGELSNVMGFYPVGTYGFPASAYTAGTRGSGAGMTTMGAKGIGSSRIPWDRGGATGGTAPSLKKGDVIQFRSGAFSWTDTTPRYMVTEAVSGENSTAGGLLNILPTLSAAVPDDTPIQVAGNRTVAGIMFSPNAFHLTMRMLPLGHGEGEAMNLVHERSGVTMQLRTWGEQFSQRYTVSCLFGAAMVDPRCCVMLLN